jgi:hypothetical protein
MAEIQPLDDHMEAKQAKTLLDTGSTASVISGKIVPRRYWRRCKNTKFKTTTGTFQCRFIVELEVVLPEISTMKSFTWNFFVDDTNQDDNYDMIIGDDCMAAIGLDIIYSRGLIKWDDSAAPMHNEGEDLPDVQEMRSMQSDDEPHTSEAIKQTANRQTRILDAKYEKADLQKIVDKIKTLNEQQRQKLLKLLQKYEILFDGTLGEFDCEPADV